MSDDAIRLDVSDGVGRITMARPEKHNAFDDRLIADLSAAFEAAGRDDAVRVVVLEGEGKSFFRFICNMCAVLGGIFTISGLVDGAVFRGMKALRKGRRLVV